MWEFLQASSSLGQYSDLALSFVAIAALLLLGVLIAGLIYASFSSRLGKESVLLMSTHTATH